MTPISTARLATCVVAVTLVSAAAATLPTEARAADGIASVPETPVTVPSVDADAVLAGVASDAVEGVVADALGGVGQMAGATEHADADSTAAPAPAPLAAAAPTVETAPTHASATPDTTPVSTDTASGIAATAPTPTSTPATAAAAGQVAPGNVNVSVRIGSPGDNGPVTQVNVAASAAVAGASPSSAATASTVAAATRPAAGTSAAPTGAHAVAAPSASQDDPETWSWQWNCLSMPDLSVIPPLGSTSGSVPRNWTWIWNCGENPTQYQEASSSQYQPSNVNIAIRISSPGNDGPVTQANVAVATRVGSVSVAAAQGTSGVVLSVPVAASAVSDVLSDAVIPSMTSLQSLAAPAEPIWLGDDVSIPATVESIVELPQTLLPLLGLRATGAADRQWLGFPGRGSRLAAPVGPLAPVGLLEPETSTSGSSGWAVASAVRSAQPHASTSGAAETPKPAPRWRAPLREPMQAPVPSGASLAPATGGGSSGGGIPVFLALPFLAAMLDLARRVTLDRVALPSGHRSRMPENPG